MYAFDLPERFEAASAHITIAVSLLSDTGYDCVNVGAAITAAAAIEAAALTIVFLIVLIKDTSKIEFLAVSLIQSFVVRAAGV